LTKSKLFAHQNLAYRVLFQRRLLMYKKLRHLFSMSINYRSNNWGTCKF